MAEIDEDVLEWEEWHPDQGSFLSHMVAGSIAGVTEHTIMYPMDTLKTHVQCDRCGKVAKSGVSLIRENCMHAFKSLVRNEGFFRLWRGVSTMFIGCIPAHAAYFSIYEQTKLYFHVGITNKEHPLGAATAGILATLSHDMVMAPCDTIKQRLQLGFYKGPLHCVKKMIRTEGLRSLFVSLPTTLSMNLPYGAVMVTCNEKLKSLLLNTPLSDSKTGKHTIATYLAAGSGAGAIAALVTTPLDMIKTRLQTQTLPPIQRSSSSGVHLNGGLNTAFGGLSSSSSSSSSSNNHIGRQTRRVMTISHPCGDVFSSTAKKMTNEIEMSTKKLLKTCNKSMRTSPNQVQLNGAFDAAKIIYIEQGLPGFMRGCMPRLLVSAPSVAVSWTAYECAKSVLKDVL